MRDAQALSRRGRLLPSVAQVPPAKTITFYKRGDPRFSGVRLAVHPRAFRSFGALVDELSGRMPLPFGVRSVTTPRGLHHLSALEQLQDGGCYLCSDKKPPKTPGGPGREQGRGHPALRRGRFQGGCGAPGTSPSWKGPEVPRTIRLRSGDPGLQQTAALSQGHTCRLASHLSQDSALLPCPGEQVFTTHGEKVDSLQSLLHNPSVLVCAGHESFRLPAMEDCRRNGAETLSGLTSRNKDGSWGLEPRQSAVRSRARVSLLSGRAGHSDTPESPRCPRMGPDASRHPQDPPARLGRGVAGDDLEKKVLVNEDGSLSVEMKVRFHLVGEDAHLWPSRVAAAGGEGPDRGRADPLRGPREFSEAGALGEWAAGRSSLRGRPRGQGSPRSAGFGPQGQLRPGTDAPRPLGAHTAQRALRPPGRGGACPRGPAPGCSSGWSSGASQDPASPSSGPRPSQHPPGVPSAASTLASRSALQGAGRAPGSSCPNFTCADLGGAGRRASSPGGRGGDGGETQAAQPRGSRTPAPEACLVCSGLCPTPPRAPTCAEKHPSSGTGSSSHRGADRGLGSRQQGEEPGPKPGAARKTGSASRRSSPSPCPSPCPCPNPRPCSSPCPSLCPSHSPRHSPCPCPNPNPSHSPYPSPCPCPSPCPSHSPRHSPCPCPCPNPNPNPSHSPCHSPCPSPCSSPSHSPCHSPCPSPGCSPCPGHSPCPCPSPCSSRALQGKVARDGGCLGEGEDGDLTPTALPHTSPEAAVCEWLCSLPEEPTLRKQEACETTRVAEEAPEGVQEDPAGQRSLRGPGDRAQATEQPLGGEISGQPGLDGAAVPGEASPGSAEGLPPRGALGSASEGGRSRRGSGGVLPSRPSAPTRVVTVLAGAGRGRPSSLPEAPSAVRGRLSPWARVLLTCLARLHFSDGDLGAPASKLRVTDSTRYQELLSAFRVLWPQAGLGREELDLGLQECESCPALPGVKPHAASEDGTPRSSSGVDVSSGSAGSGESSMPCAVDWALSPKRLELPLKVAASSTSSQRPDSRSAANPGDPRNQPRSCSKAPSNFQAWACVTSKDEAGENSKEQVLAGNLEQFVENWMQGEGMQVVRIKEEAEREATQEKGIEEEAFPEKERINEVSSVAPAQAGEGTRGGKRRQEAAGGGPGSAARGPSAMGGRPAEPTGSPSKRDSNARGSPRGPGFELPGETGMGDGHAQAHSPQGPGEKGLSVTRRASLGADPTWVLELLRKTEAAFMAHLASATAEVRARWSLQDSQLLDQMVAELERGVGRRLRRSLGKELGEMRGRAWGTVPPEAPGWEARRRRLRGLHNLPAFAERAGGGGLPWLSRGGEAAGAGFCPCEACLRTAGSPRSPERPAGAASAPPGGALDLQRILQVRRAEAAPRKGGAALG